jgi:hypothetical protein
MGFMNYTAARLYQDAQLLEARKRLEIKRNLSEAGIGEPVETGGVLTRFRCWFNETMAQVASGQGEPAPC